MENEVVILFVAPTGEAMIPVSKVTAFGAEVSHVPNHNSGTAFVHFNGGHIVANVKDKELALASILTVIRTRSDDAILYCNGFKLSHT